MKLCELSKELDVASKDLITYLTDKGFTVKSHMITLTDEMTDLILNDFIATTPPATEEPKKVNTKSKKQTAKKDISPLVKEKKFSPTDRIPCKSVTPYKLNAVGVDKKTVYHWEYFGDIDYVTYEDLQALRRKQLITAPKVLIQDADLCYQWRRELGDTYKYYLGVEYPEEFFDLSDTEFEDRLKRSDDNFKEVIKITAINMINNKNYPTVIKLSIIDDVLGTCLKEFL